MKKIFLVITLFILMLLVGCSELFKDVEITITVDSYSIEVDEGDFVFITPTVTGSNNGLYYDSSNTNIFTVSNGVISGVSEGVAELTIGVINTEVAIKVIVKVNKVVVADTPGDETEEKPPIIIDDKPENPSNKVFLISNGNQNLVVGEEVNLLALLGGVIINENISWMSSNEGVVTVSSAGLLTTKAAGNAMILALYGNLSATINVTVRVPDVVVVKPTSIIINGSSFVNVDNQVLLTVTPNQGAVSSLIWTSSDDSKATVNNFGIVTGISTGVVVITATLADNLSVSNTFTLFVKEAETSASPITSITLTGTSEVLAGNKIKLNLSYTPANEPATFTFSSSNTSVATVDVNGWVTGVSGGKVQITASLVGDSEKKASFSVTVIPLPEGITVNGASTVSYGQNIILTATAYPVGSSSIVTWTSSDASIASIDSNGRVTGMKVGTTTITATSIVSASIKATHQVTVTDQMSITLNPTTINLTTGGSATIAATVVAASLTDKSVAWTSSNASVATVDSNGKVTAVAQGSANIIAKLNANNSIQAQASVIVTAPSLPTITLSDTTASLLVGATKTLTATVGNASDTSVTWTTSNATVATVSGGVVTAKVAGSVTITATSVANTSVKATCTITVTAPPATGGTLTITQTPAGTIEVGATGYELFIKDEEGAAVSRLECTFTSSNSGVATVSTWGTISALAAGSAKITVTHQTKGTGTITLTIGSGSTPPTGTLTITQSPAGTISVGATGYELFIKDSSGASISRLECTFTPSDSTIATVSSYGTISALKAGTTTITVTHPTKGTGTITVTIGSGGNPVNTATDDTGKATYTRDTSISSTSTVPGSTATTYIKEYGTVGTKTIRVSLLEQKCNSNAKIVSWVMQNSNGYRFTNGSVSSIAANYESTHPGWRVLGGINADQYTLGFGTGLGVDGKHPYHVQPYYPLIADGQKWFSRTWMASGSGSAGNFVGYTNDGSVDQLVSVNAANAGTTLKLSILNSNGTVANKYTVNKFNSSPASGEVALYTGYYSDTSLGTFLSKSVSGTNVFVVGSADLAYCNNTSAYTKVAATQNAFYGKGNITSKTTSATLASRQFAIVSNNSTVTSALAVGKKILVQYEYNDATYNAFESGMGYHTVQRNGGADQAVSGTYNTNNRPRSVVGRKADGTIVLMIIDDYNDSYGTTGYGINAICKLHGIVEAYQMDGGGSAQMAVRQSNGTFAGVTRSADEATGANTGSQRAIMSALLFVVKV
ncbi:MAG: Ig-like domain-containing protein [Bacilli bacterium]